MRNMYHHREVLEALCTLCSGATRLALDTDATSTVCVGSNRLFEVGDAVELVDDVTAPEAHTVSALSGLSEVVLGTPVVGTYEAARNARLRLAGADVPALTWIGRGRPEATPLPSPLQFPCVVVEPRQLVQPPKGGTNRTVTQEHSNSVYYIRRRAEGEEQEAALLTEVGRLFNLLMSDPYLGGTCWHSEVSLVDYVPEAERVLRERGIPVRVVRFDVLSRRSASVAGA